MTDLHDRFRTLDQMSTPNLWHEIEERAMAAQPMSRRLPWVLIVAVLLLVLAIGGAALVGSGIVKLPISVDASATPSSTAQESTLPSSTPVAQVPASWTAVGDMIEARTMHSATQLLDGTVLVAGGYGIATGESSRSISASAELYDPSRGQWTATGAMTGVRVGHTATLLPDGRVLVAGGHSCTDFDGCPLASAELYDPDTGTWTATGSMIGAGPGRTATLLPDGRVLVAGGTGSDFELVAFTEVYDPRIGSWSAAGEMVGARAGHTATVLLDGRVLVAGGSTDRASAELYDPVNDSWTATGPLIEGRVGHTATLLSDGKVLVAGSGAGSDAQAAAELYDPGTGQWTATVGMIEARSEHRATLLPGGMVLVAGGATSVDDPVALASAELYDPVSGSWTATATMAEGRYLYTVTLLRDGTVLVAGGSVAGDGTLASAEVYDPGSGT